jgi:acetyl-CoA acetyltransferase
MIDFSLTEQQVALGHPFGDSGTRGVLTLATDLAERGARHGCLGICVGSGQGVAIVLERMSS